MTNRLLRNVSIPTMALLHLYISGSLYLIGYWSTFGLDVSNAVDFLEIPKSFIYPFIVSLGLFFFIVLINFISYSIFPKPKKPIKNNNEDVNTNHKKGSKIDYFIFFTPPVLIIAFFIFGETELFWILSGGYISFLLFIKVIFSKEVHNAVPNFTYFIPVIFLLIFTPIMSFSLGKANGLGVFQNRDIKYISINNTNIAKEILANKDQVSGSLKLLGFLGSKLIVSSLDNERIYFINQFDFLGVQISKKPI